MKQTKNKRQVIYYTNEGRRVKQTKNKRQVILYKTQYARFISFVFCLLSFFLCINAAWAQMPEPSPPKGGGFPHFGGQGAAGIPWHISADKIEYDYKTGQYIAKGNVIIRKENEMIRADIIRLDDKTMIASAQGSVEIRAGKDILFGEKIEIDLNSGTGTLYSGSLFIHENHFYIKADSIQKKKLQSNDGYNIYTDSYTALGASVSSCDGDNPAWEITGEKIDVTIEGYGFVKHAVMWVKGVPVVFMPFFIFPVKLKRQSGLLAPRIGYSDRFGAWIEQPVYWAFNDSSDATFYAHLMEKRGTKTGAELRYILNENSKGALMFDFLDDRNTDMDSIRADSLPLTNTDRYWFRMKHDQVLPMDFHASLDIDIVSDTDYLPEFKSGYSGFDETNQYFSETFGRDIDDYNETVRINSLTINRLWTQSTLFAQMRWYDDIINRQDSDENASYHKLPWVRFNTLKHRISTYPVYWNIDSEYVYFYSNGTAPNGHRLDISPRFHMPLFLWSYISADPSIGLREIAWEFDGNVTNKETADVKIDLSTELFRIFNLKSKRIRHTIRPQITYEYIPPIDYPLFDYENWIEKRNRISFSMTHTLTAKRTETSHLEKRDKAEFKSSANFNRICRFFLEQSYDIDESNDSDSGNFSPIYAEISLAPSPFFGIAADSEWSHDTGRFLSRNYSALIKDMRGDSLFAQHRYTHDAGETISFVLSLNIMENLSALAGYERNLRADQEIKNMFKIQYSAQCWSAEVGHINEGGDHTWSFMVNLYGLGKVQ